MDLRPIYGIDAGTFRDANGDGIGDLRGITESLDYVERLGAGWIWLLPFYTSPMRDNGYDVSDYYGVDPPLGNLGDFVQLCAEARRRNLRVLIDLVINHTSDQHPWFRAARADPAGPFRDYYCWTDDPPPLDQQRRPIFPDRVPSSWTWDEAVGAFYFHQFYPFQPTLNHRNPAVRDEVRRILEFWLQLGVTAFRIDAAHHLGEPAIDPGSPESLEIIEGYRAIVPDEATLLGEADLPADELRRYLGPDRLQLLFDFIGNGHTFLAFVQESARPLVEALDRRGPAPEGTAWVPFLRNLDEVDLERLVAEDQQRVLEELAPEPRMRIFGRGIRRRLASILDDPRRIRLAFSLLLAQPGVPMIVYGDEIGMGDDQELPGRKAVRTAMQWTAGPAAGFSAAPEHRLRVPVVRRGDRTPEHVNVEAQERDPDSLLAFVRRAIATRTEHLHGREHVEVRAVADERVLATCARSGDRTVVTLGNISSRPARVEPFWGAGERRILLGSAAGADGNGSLELEPWGHCWLAADPA